MESNNSFRVLLAINEKLKSYTSLRITKLCTILEIIPDLSAYCPTDDQTPENMLSSGDCRFNYMIINYDHEDFDNLINIAKKYFPFIKIICIIDNHIDENFKEIYKHDIVYYLQKTEITIQKMSGVFSLLSFN